MAGKWKAYSQAPSALLDLVGRDCLLNLTMQANAVTALISPMPCKLKLAALKCKAGLQILELLESATNEHKKSHACDSCPTGDLTFVVICSTAHHKSAVPTQSYKKAVSLICI